MHISRKVYRLMDRVIDQLEDRNQARSKYDQVVQKLNRIQAYFERNKDWSDNFYTNFFPWLWLQENPEAKYVYSSHTGADRHPFYTHFNWLIQDYWENDLQEFYREPETYEQPVTLSDEQLELLHLRSLDNFSEVQDSHFCGCFQCLQIYHRSEIDDWTDNSAVCPYCNVDSVLGDMKQPINLYVLRLMSQKYFS